MVARDRAEYRHLRCLCFGHLGEHQRSRRRHFYPRIDRALDLLDDTYLNQRSIIDPVIIDDTEEAAVSFSGFRQFHYAEPPVES